MIFGKKYFFLFKQEGFQMKIKKKKTKIFKNLLNSNKLNIKTPYFRKNILS